MRFTPAAALLECLQIPVALFSRHGTLISCSDDARTMLDVEGPVLLAELGALASRVGASPHGDAGCAKLTHVLTRPSWPHVWRASLDHSSLGTDEAYVVCALIFIPKNRIEQEAQVRRGRHDVERVLAKHGLSTRERAVAHEILTGATSSAIAVRLKISVHTVRRHTEKVLTKLRVRSRVAVAHAVSELLDRGADATNSAA